MENIYKICNTSNEIRYPFRVLHDYPCEVSNFERLLKTAFCKLRQHSSFAYLMHPLDVSTEI